MAKTQLPDPFPISADMRAWADRTVPRLDIDYYHDEFCDHWWANGQKKASWLATWRNWMRRTNNGSAPGMYGPEDRSIRRKQPRPVPQSELELTPPTPIESYHARKDRAAERARALGMGLVEANRASLDALELFIANAEGDRHGSTGLK